MKKLKFFVSLLKERDWLEHMATQGWLLTDITLGVLYHFKQIEPCEKVYEIEHFVVTSRSTIADLTAKTNALDITSQFGWEQITHDEDMRYYFVKDKAGDETDEFYDDESRLERAERFRNYYCIDMPSMVLPSMLVLSAVYIIFFLLMTIFKCMDHFLLWLYIICIVYNLATISYSIVCGQRTYTELCMSRKEWELYKKNTEKKHFKKVQQLRSYLQEKSEFGLSLKGYQNGHFLFEEDTQRYNYFIDTKNCLKKRLKENGLRYTEETKDILTQSTKWYEMSIANATQYDLKPVAIINKSILIYKRPYSEKPLPWENGNENINHSVPVLATILFLFICAIIGCLIGFLAAKFIV